MRGIPSRSRPLAVRATLAVAAGAVIAVIATGGIGIAQQAGEWPNITGGNNGARYSPLDQINASNFNNLKVAWEWRGVEGRRASTSAAR